MTIKQIKTNYTEISYMNKKIKELNKSNKNKILLDTIKNYEYCEMTEKEREDEEEKEKFIINSFEPRAYIQKKYFKKYKEHAFRDYYLQISFYTSSKTNNFHSYIEPHDFKYISLGKNIEEEKDLILYSIKEHNGIAIFTKINQYNKEKSMYKNSFYYTIIDNIKNVDYIIPDRIASLMSLNRNNHDSMLIKELNYQFDVLNLNVYFSSAGEWLNIYPSDTVKQKIIENKNLIIDFCNKRDLIFCYSENYQYNKKAKEYIQKIDSIDPKIGFIKKDYFKEWTENFNLKKMDDIGIFCQYKTKEIQHEYNLLNVFVEQL